MAVGGAGTTVPGMSARASRSDNRRPDQLRPITFEANIAPHATGSVLVSFGATRVICAAMIEPKVPTWMRQQGVKGGWLTAEYSMLPYSTLERKQRDVTKGKVFDGYQNRAFQRETIEGIEVVRVWSYITANEGFVRRILDYLSFMLSAILVGPWVRKVDVIVGTSPQQAITMSGSLAWSLLAHSQIPMPAVQWMIAC